MKIDNQKNDLYHLGLFIFLSFILSPLNRFNQSIEIKAILFLFDY